MDLFCSYRHYCRQQSAPVLAGRTPTWGDVDAVAIDNGPLLLLLLGGLNSSLLHVSDGLVALPLALCAGSGARQDLLRYI